MKYLNSDDLDLLTKKIGNDVNIEYLDSGGQRDVFKCNYQNQLCVLKCIKLNKENNLGKKLAVENALKRLKIEIDTLKSCNSPNLVNLGPIDPSKIESEDSVIIYFSEEYIDGLDLEKVKCKLEFTNDDLVELCLNICDAIFQLDKQNKVHRDIKPSNIIKRDNGTYVLLDLGYVLDLTLIDSFSRGIVGTTLYYSPEQLDYINRRKRMDFRSDLFSLGIILYELATKAHPFYNSKISSEDEYYQRLLNHNPERPIQINSNLNKDLDEVIMKMLSKSPHGRYRKVDFLIDEINSLNE